MKQSDLYRAMSDLDDDLIAETERVWLSRIIYHRAWKKAALLAACLALCANFLIGAANYSNVVEQSAILDGLVGSELIRHQIQPFDGYAADMTADEKTAYIDSVYDQTGQYWADESWLQLGLKDQLQYLLDSCYQTTLPNMPVTSGIIPRIYSIALETGNGQEYATVRWSFFLWEVGVEEEPADKSGTVTYSIYAPATENYMISVMVKEDGLWKLLRIDDHDMLDSSLQECGFSNPQLTEHYATQEEAIAAAQQMSVPDETYQPQWTTDFGTVAYWGHGRLETFAEVLRDSPVGIAYWALTVQ